MQISSILRLLIGLAFMPVLSSAHTQSAGSGAQQIDSPQPKQPIPPDSSFAEARHLAQEGKFDEAIAQLDAIADKQPDAKGLSHELGIVYYKKSDYVRAIANLKKALAEDPGDNEALQLLGISNYLAGRPTDAIPALEKVQTWYPSANRCLVHSWHLLHANQGLSQLTQSLREDVCRAA